MHVPSTLEDRWPIFSLIDARKITWTEADTTMSMCDVLDLHDACNAIFDAQHARQETADSELGDQ